MDKEEVKIIGLMLGIWVLGVFTFGFGLGLAMAL